MITGSARGIGRVLAQELAAVGTKVVIADIKVEESENTVQVIQEAGGDAIAIPTDVRKRQDCQNLIEKTVAHYDRLDIMLCNAGIDILKPAVALEELEWDNIINTKDDVVFTYEEIYKNPAIPSYARDFLKIGKNREFPTVKKLDDWRVEFTLPQPFAPFVRITRMEVLPAHVLQSLIQKKRCWGSAVISLSLEYGYTPRTNY